MTHGQRGDIVMLYAVLFTDNEDYADQRQRHMAAHLAFLEANGDKVRAAGPLRDGESGAGAGGLWLVDAPDLEAVRVLYEADPFWPTGLRKAIRVLAWTQVFAEGARRI
jgi:uncharacterized protein